VKFLSAFLWVLIFTIPAFSQKQLVLLKGEDVLLRLYPGDEIKLKVKGKKGVMVTYINNLFENRLVTHRDTIPFANIERLYFKRPMRINIIGGAMVFGGVVLFGIDQLNHSAIQGNDASLDRGVTTTSIALVGIGLPMLLTKRNSTKLNYKHRLLTVKEGSIFYRKDTRGFVSPYIQN
jgi:hypothetical protein